MPGGQITLIAIAAALFAATAAMLLDRARWRAGRGCKRGLNDPPPTPLAVADDRPRGLDAMELLGACDRGVALMPNGPARATIGW